MSPNTGPNNGPRVLALGLAVYAVAAHLGLAYETPLPAILLLCTLTGIGAVHAFRDRSVGRALLLTAASCLVVLFAAGGRGQLAIYLPPLLITLSLFLLFAGSLRPGQTPLVTGLARLLEGDLPPDVAHYTRRVTIAWALFLALMNGELWLLALLAPAELWSLFANFINYILLLLFFAGEYWLRRRCLPHRHQPGFILFLRQLSTIRLSEVAKR